MAKQSKEFGEGIGNSGFTLGILSILLAGTMGILIAVVGLIFSVLQQRKNPTKLGKVGVILNIIGFILSIAFIIYLVPIFQSTLQA